MKMLKLPLREQLTQRWLWWRHSYPFRFAHKPLCDRLGSRVLRVGHVHLCRGCSLLYIGVAIGFALALLVEITPAARFVLAYGVAVPAFLASWPSWYARLPGAAKDLSRLAVGAAVVWLCSFLWWGPWWLGLANVAALVFARQFYVAQRRRRLRRACDGCPELGAGEICSGFSLQAACARRFEEAASQQLMQIELPIGGNVRS